MERSRRRAVVESLVRHPLAYISGRRRRRPAPHPEVAPPSGCEEALQRLATLPISTWTYGWEDPSVTHLGPMAQDFAATFGLGAHDDRIEHVDASGVLFAAVKALLTRVEVAEAEIAELRAASTGTEPRQ